VAEAVRPEVAALAHGLDVGGIGADGLAGAEVGYGEADLSPGPDGPAALALQAAAGFWVGLVEAALSGALALSLGAFEDLGAKELPVGRVE
jgi:hypothetical protein